jgi:hypothetical protein
VIAEGIRDRQQLAPLRGLRAGLGRGLLPRAPERRTAAPARRQSRLDDSLSVSPHGEGYKRECAAFVTAQTTSSAPTHISAATGWAPTAERERAARIGPATKKAEPRSRRAFASGGQALVRVALVLLGRIT